MYCKNCGNQIPDGTKFCPNCGAQTDSTAPKTETYTGTVHSAGGHAPTRRNLGVCILLSIVTCGIYGIVWLIQMADELNAAAGEVNGTSGVTVFLLSLVTCGIYGFYWYYKAGDLVDRASGLQDRNRGILYLLLAIFGLSIVSMALIQDELNKLA